MLYSTREGEVSGSPPQGEHTFAQSPTYSLDPVAPWYQKMRFSQPTQAMLVHVDPRQSMANSLPECRCEHGQQGILKMWCNRTSCGGYCVAHNRVVDGPDDKRILGISCR